MQPKTQYYAASSLDGFIATRDHSLEWLLQFGSTDSTSYPSFIRDVGALAMGSATYEWLLRHLGDAEAWPYSRPAWVFTSRQLPSRPGADVRFVSGDVRPVHADMAAAAGGKIIWIVGGGELAGKFYDAGLLDELIIQVTAVTLGDGLPLLPRQIAHPPLRLLSATTFGEAFAELRYAVPKKF
jgi:dihydrofolate reductase